MEMKKPRVRVAFSVLVKTFFRPDYFIKSIWRARLMA